MGRDDRVGQTRYRLTLLGGFALAWRGDDGAEREVAINGGKAKLLLAHLALVPAHRQTRERLADLLWDAPESLGRDNLRQLLARLRRSFAGLPSPLVMTGDAVALDCTAISADTDRLLTFSGATSCADLVNLCASYGGTLLQGIEPTSRVASRWLRQEQEHLEHLAVAALRRLVTCQSEAGQVHEAIDTARRLAALDRFDEAAQREVIALLARFRGPQAGLAYGIAFQQKFRQAMGCDVDAQTTALLNSLAAQRLVRPDGGAAAATASPQLPTGGVPDTADDLWAVEASALALIQRFEQAGNADARALLQRHRFATRRKARLAAMIAWALFWAAECRWLDDHAHGVEQARRWSKFARKIDRHEPFALTTAGFILSSQGNHRLALPLLREAVARDGADPMAHMLLGWGLIRVGDVAAAVAETGLALALDQRHSLGTMHMGVHGLALLAAGRPGEALGLLQAAVLPYRHYFGHHLTLISCYGHLGLKREAQELIIMREQALGRPITCQTVHAALGAYAHRDIFVEGLRRAGVP